MSKSTSEIDTLYAEVQRRMIENGEWDRWVFHIFISYVLRISHPDYCISCPLSCLKADGQMIFCIVPKVCPFIVIYMPDFGSTE